ncbi:30S ribosomal protein S6e [Candidatus Pacearchaeota archaeon]|nr:30S ribosomal protein S6e [Candidatus Pacearchaeota archaeon]
MPMKINISDNGIAWRIQLESEALHGKKIGDTMPGKELLPELEGYELEITGGSDTAGFPLAKKVEGVYLKRLLLTKGFGMKENKPRGLRRRKTVRGNQVSATTALLNMKVLKTGNKPLTDIFADQNKPKVEEKKAGAPVPAA